MGLKRGVSIPLLPLHTWFDEWMYSGGCSYSYRYCLRSKRLVSTAICGDDNTEQYKNCLSFHRAWQLAWSDSFLLYIFCFKASGTIHRYISLPPMATSEAIHSNAQYHADLLQTLSSIEYAPSALTEQTRYLQDLRAQLAQVKGKVDKLAEKTKKERKEHEDIRDSMVRRVASKVVGRKASGMLGCCCSILQVFWAAMMYLTGKVWGKEAERRAVSIFEISCSAGLILIICLTENT